MSFADDQAWLLESTGLWPCYPYLPLKRWTDEKADYEYGLIRQNPATGLYEWYPHKTLDALDRGESPAATFAKGQVEAQLFDIGWMVYI